MDKTLREHIAFLEGRIVQLRIDGKHSRSVKGIFSARRLPVLAPLCRGG
jgi:hypothetical protein